MREKTAFLEMSQVVTNAANQASVEKRAAASAR